MKSYLERKTDLIIQELLWLYTLKQLKKIKIKKNNLTRMHVRRSKLTPYSAIQNLIDLECVSREHKWTLYSVILDLIVCWLVLLTTNDFFLVQCKIENMPLIPTPQSDRNIVPNV